MDDFAARGTIVERAGMVAEDAITGRTAVDRLYARIPSLTVFARKDGRAQRVGQLSWTLALEQEGVW